jgi:hypothetical protein
MHETPGGEEHSRQQQVISRVSSYQILRSIGLFDEVAWDLALRPHCTPELVCQHLALVRARRDGLHLLVSSLKKSSG